MVQIEKVMERIKQFVSAKIEEIAQSNNLVMIFKPVVRKVSDKAICKIEKVMKLMADENGMIDVDNIMTEMIDGLSKVASKEYPEFSEGLMIGGGEIKMDIPMTNKTLVISNKDLEELRKFIMQ